VIVVLHVVGVGDVAQAGFVAAEDGLLAAAIRDPERRAESSTETPSLWLNLPDRM